MKKNFFILSALLSVFCCSVAFTSCSDDDDDDNSNPSESNVNITQKNLVKVTTVLPVNGSTDVFVYNWSDNKLMSSVWTANIYDSTYVFETTYDYGQAGVVTVHNGITSSVDSYELGENGMAKFLEDKDDYGNVNQQTINYNSDNQISVMYYYYHSTSSSFESRDTMVYEYDANGSLIKDYQGNVYSYSSNMKLNKGNLGFYNNNIDTDLICGFWGAGSKYLPASCVDEDGLNYTYDWVLDGDGYPTKVTVTCAEDETESIIYNFEWK